MEATRAGGGRPPSQPTEVLIEPDMQRATGGGRGGGGEGGVTGVRLGNALGSGLGAFLRGFTLAGGVGGVGGPGGNVGDYAFGDLSQLIQQLMAADPNRVSYGCCFRCTLASGVSVDCMLWLSTIGKQPIPLWR